MTNAQNEILTFISETLATRDDFIKDTMKFAYKNDNAAAGEILHRAEILEFDETLMILEAR